MTVAYVFVALICTAVPKPPGSVVDLERCVRTPAMPMATAEECVHFRDKLLSDVSEGVAYRPAPDGSKEPKFCRPQEGQLTLRVGAKR